MSEKTYIEGRHVPVAADVGNGVERVCEQLSEILTKARRAGFPESELRKIAELRVSLYGEGLRVAQLGIDRFCAARRGEAGLK